MDNCGTSLTVFFEDPFWIGIVERIEDGKLMAAKHVFGAEPTGIEILDYVKNHYDDLKFSPAVACPLCQDRCRLMEGHLYEVYNNI